MEILGYTIWKPLVTCEGICDKEPFETPLLIFIKNFPELINEFYAGNEFWVTPKEEYVDFLKTLISERLQIITNKGDWRADFSKEQLKLFENSEMIVQSAFLGKQYEINVMNRFNSITISLISFYNNLVAVKQNSGLKVIPKIKR
ncbi:hypothetical protein [Kordia sp.]|uniref:hypothetical protein n=1 Tax=Kordia sp. TaxID=1965332 RepID=UPI0025BB5E07|nr:hypothetical protein [Kordia sp.]MCH2196584.1 hypothetical protein [Kordia sp.]